MRSSFFNGDNTLFCILDRFPHILPQLHDIRINLHLRLPVFIPVVDLQGEEDTHDDEYDFTDSIPHVT